MDAVSTEEAAETALLIATEEMVLEKIILALERLATTDPTRLISIVRGAENTLQRRYMELQHELQRLQQLQAAGPLGYVPTTLGIYQPARTYGYSPYELPVGTTFGVHAETAKLQAAQETHRQAVGQTGFEYKANDDAV